MDGGGAGIFGCGTGWDAIREGGNDVRSGGDGISVMTDGGSMRSHMADSRGTGEIRCDADGGVNETSGLTGHGAGGTGGCAAERCFQQIWHGHISSCREGNRQYGCYPKNRLERNPGATLRVHASGIQEEDPALMPSILPKFKLVFRHDLGKKGIPWPFLPEL